MHRATILSYFLCSTRWSQEKTRLLVGGQGAGTWENKGQEVKEEREGSRSSRKAEIIH